MMLGLEKKFNVLEELSLDVRNFKSGGSGSCKVCIMKNSRLLFADQISSWIRAIECSISAQRCCSIL